MKSQGVHAHEDRLLDFAYGELPPSEARLMEQHVQGCSRCSEALDGIRGVRTSMSRLSLEPAPDAGLESLMAYAQQAVRRSAAGPEPAPRWWRRLLAPALGVAAMSVFGVVVLQVNREVDLSPALKKEAAQEQVARQDVAGSTATPAAPASSEAEAEAERMHAKFDEEIRAAPMPAKPLPKSVPRSERPAAGAGSAGGFPDKKIGTRQPPMSKRGEPWPAQPSAPRAEPARDDDALLPAEPQAAQEDAWQAPGRPQGANVAPPPPPAPAAGALPAWTEGLEARKAVEAAPKTRGKSATPKDAPSPAELLQQAEAAYRSGDRAQEVAFLRTALTGAQGAQRIKVLSRLCEAELALGRRQNAIDICKRVMMEAPGSSEARLAQRHLESQLASPVDEADSELKPASPEAQ